jgi:hypothetical protein
MKNEVIEIQRQLDKIKEDNKIPVEHRKYQFSKLHFIRQIWADPPLEEPEYEISDIFGDRWVVLSKSELKDLVKYLKTI